MLFMIDNNVYFHFCSQHDIIENPIYVSPNRISDVSQLLFSSFPYIFPTHYEIKVQFCTFQNTPDSSRTYIRCMLFKS